jgi:hypothetical protein
LIIVIGIRSISIGIVMGGGRWVILEGFVTGERAEVEGGCLGEGGEIVFGSLLHLLIGLLMGIYRENKISKEININILIINK